MLKILAFLVLAGGAAYLYMTWKPAPPPHRYSTDDVFYLRQSVSIKTAHGIIGLLPGEEVWLNAGAQPISGKVMVNAGKDVVAVDRSALTHDIDEAEELRNGDAQGQTQHAAF